MSYHRNWLWFKKHLKRQNLSQVGLSYILGITPYKVQRFSDYLRIPSNLFDTTAKALGVTKHELEKRFSYGPQVETSQP